ncbi:MAG: zinc ribbon domain-containing protein [bacterium]
MKCPKCGHDQPDDALKCQRCGIIFTRPGAPRIPVKPTAKIPAKPLIVTTVLPNMQLSSRPSLLTMLGVLFTILIIVGILWWLYNTEGLPVLGGSYISDTGFALYPPYEWAMLTKDNYLAFFESEGNKFPEQLRPYIANNKIEVGFIKLLDEKTFSPSVNVTLTEINMPVLDEEAKDEAVKVISEEFSKVVDNYELLKAELLEIDKTTSLRLLSRATVDIKVKEGQTEYFTTPRGKKRVTGRSPDQWSSYTLKFEQTFIRAKNKAFIVTCTALESQYQEYKPKFDNILSSFRVIDRPPRFGIIMMGAIQGGLYMMLASLLLYLITGIVRLFKPSAI